MSVPSFQIVAVILCNTGIALLAYMDGVTGTPTLGGVVLAAAAAAGFAVHKVLFRRVMGDALTFCQASSRFELRSNGACSMHMDMVKKLSTPTHRAHILPGLLY